MSCTFLWLIFAICEYRIYTTYYRAASFTSTLEINGLAQCHCDAVSKQACMLWRMTSKFTTLIHKFMIYTPVKQMIFATIQFPCELTFEASPYGKKLPYIFLNSSTLKWPLGQSFRKPLYHSWISASKMKLKRWNQS